MSSISIIIPVYNKEEFIKETLLSIWNQDFQDWECLLVDDGSSDNSVMVIEEFISDKPRFKLMFIPGKRNKGASTCRNFGLEISSSKYVQFLDADDIISKTKLESQVQIMENDPSVDLVTCKWGRLNNAEEEIYNDLSVYNNFSNIPEFLKMLTQSKGYFPLHAYLLKKETIKRAGLWNENLSLNDDGEFMMRILSFSRKIRFASKPYVLYRYSTGSNASSYNDIVEVERAIYSWKLIEVHLALGLYQEQIFFTEWSKGKLFINVKNSFPELIDKHKDFFKFQLQQERSKRRLINRLLKKLKKWKG
ncbi:glycosyltransferase family 2 protein [Autumnicola musiva]|uniref:Glycosyltransferase n=1 Tax=Autumnicola musiva TaxID=3075589 RepID=A0ABU3D723_9FLAO|nr:glycosyltransferase [Zunongwangia sp. F117]MDT0676803.1 glycosyltransferase [Zunongwangia sp. F117]